MANAPREGWSKDHNALAKTAGFKSWAGWIKSIEKKKGFAVCGRRNTRKTPCLRHAGAASRRGKKTGHLGTGACGDHGGLSKAGTEVWSYKDGARSKYHLHGSLAERQNRLQKELQAATDLTSEIEVLDVLLVTIAEEFPDIDPGAVRETTKRVRETLKKAGTLKSQKAKAALLDSLSDSLEELDRVLLLADEAYLAVDRFVGVADAKRKLVDSEVRRQKTERGPINWIDADVLAERFAQILVDHVSPDKATPAIHAFEKEFASLGMIRLPTEPAEA